MEMGLVKVCRTSSLKLKHGVVNEEEASGFVRYSRGLGRKRIGMSNEMEESLLLDSATEVPLLKRQCSERMMMLMMMMMMIDDYHEKSALESLPQDVIIRIICGVDHEDLKQLVTVSKSIKDAANCNCKAVAFCL